MTPLDARRASLEQAVRDVAERLTPRNLQALRALASALAPGAWTPGLLLEVAELLPRGQLPPAPIGLAVFPAVATTVLEVHVAVTVRERGEDELSAPDESTMRPVTDAVTAARQLLGVPSPSQGGAALSVTFSPATGWSGGSCGLAVALAVASAVRQNALRRGVWATGRVEPDGRVLSVEGLAQKSRASEGRTLLRPPTEKPDAEGERRVHTLAQALAEALEAPSMAVLVERIARHTQRWLEGRGWDPKAHVEHAVDTALMARWSSGAACFAIAGAPASGTRWRLAWLATHVSQQSHVLLLEPLGDDTGEALAEALASVLGPSGSHPRDDTCIDTWLSCLARIAHEGERPVMLGLVRPGPIVRGILGEASFSGVRYVWTQDLDDSDDEVPRVVCPDDLLAGRAETLVARGLPRSRWTPENRVVLATPLALDVVKSLGVDGWPSGVLLRNDLLQEVREGASRRVGRFRAVEWAWSALADHLRLSPGTAWCPRGGPRGHDEACARLVRAGVLTRVPKGFRVVDSTLALALQAGAIERVAFAEGVLPVPETWLAERARARGLTSPWDDVLVRGLLGKVAGAILERWIMDLAAACRRAWSGGLDERRAVLELGVGLARADLLRAGRRPSVLARLLSLLSRDDLTPQDASLAPTVASGAALATIHDTWPLAWRRRRRALRVLGECLARTTSSPAHARLSVLRSMLGAPGDLAVDLEALPASVDAGEDPAWAPLVHAAVLEQGWPDVDDTPSAGAFQEALAEAYWRRCVALHDDGEEARAVAHGRLRAAQARGDTEAVDRWRGRDHGHDPHTLGGDAERSLARQLLVVALVGSR